MYFYCQYFRNFEIAYSHNINNTLSFTKVINCFYQNKNQICLSSLATIPWLKALNHIGCCIQILENVSNDASIKLHFNKYNLFNNK